VPVRPIQAFAAALLALALGAARADPGYYVVTAYSDPGVRTVDFRYWTVKRKGRPEMIWPEVGFGWNVNSRWHTELFASWIGSSQMATRLSTLNWQNDVLLTQGELPFDLALHTQYVKDETGDPNAFEFGPVFQTDVGRTQLNANAFFERTLGSTKPTRMKYQWQVRHRWRPWLHFGAQGFGELGEWDDWAPRAKQSHRAGPALFGSVPLGERTLGWQAAWLTGSTYARHGHMFTARLKLDF
jgi:hypothetical protein